MVEVEIRRDGGGGEQGEQTREVAEIFNFTHGNKVMRNKTDYRTDEC